MSTLRDLIFKRPSRQFQYLHVLLDLSSHEKDKVRSQALLFIKRMYEKEQLREYVEKFALNYLQLLVHPNPPSVLFGADKDTGLAQVLQRCSELGDGPLGETARQQELERAQVAKAGACGNPERVPGPA